MSSNNKKERTKKLEALADRILSASGVDVNQEVLIRPLAKRMIGKSECAYVTAKRHISKAIRRALGLPTPARGGKRPGAGRKSNKYLESENKTYRTKGKEKS